MSTSLPTLHKFTADEYQRMGEVGILCEDDRVELIEGEIVDMAAIGNRHLAAVDRLTKLFAERVGNRAIVRVQGSVRLNDRSEPEPDLVLLRWRSDFYEASSAGPADMLLAVEVADTSLDYDREVKAPLYARTGVPEYWLVDLEAKTITVYREPGPDGYRSFTAVRGQELISPQGLADLTVRVDDVIPSPPQS